jgi:hypothetical protein
MCRIATPQLNVEESDLYLIGTIFKSSISHFNGSWSWAVKMHVKWCVRWSNYGWGVKEIRRDGKSFHAGLLVQDSEKPTEIVRTCGRDQNKISTSRQYASVVQARSKATDWEGTQHGKSKKLEVLDVVVCTMKWDRQSTRCLVKLISSGNLSSEISVLWVVNGTLCFVAIKE